MTKQISIKISFHAQVLSIKISFHAQVTSDFRERQRERKRDRERQRDRGRQTDREMFKINFLKNFAIFTGKHLRWSAFLTKLQSFNTCGVFL